MVPPKPGRHSALSAVADPSFLERRSRGAGGCGSPSGHLSLSSSWASPPDHIDSLLDPPLSDTASASCSVSAAFSGGAGGAGSIENPAMPKANTPPTTRSLTDTPSTHFLAPENQNAPNSAAQPAS